MIKAIRGFIGGFIIIIGAFIKGRPDPADTATTFKIIGDLLRVLPDSMHYLDEDETWEDAWVRLSPEAQDIVRDVRARSVALAISLSDHIDKGASRTP